MVTMLSRDEISKTKEEAKSSIYAHASAHLRIHRNGLDPRPCLVKIQGYIVYILNFFLNAHKGVGSSREYHSTLGFKTRPQSKAPTYKVSAS
jgi:hypothetical protein